MTALYIILFFAGSPAFSARRKSSECSFCCIFLILLWKEAFPYRGHAVPVGNRWGSAGTSEHPEATPSEVFHRHGAAKRHPRCGKGSAGFRRSRYGAARRMPRAFRVGALQASARRFKDSTGRVGFGGRCRLETRDLREGRTRQTCRRRRSRRRRRLSPRFPVPRAPSQRGSARKRLHGLSHTGRRCAPPPWKTASGVASGCSEVPPLPAVYHGGSSGMEKHASRPASRFRSPASGRPPCRKVSERAVKEAGVFRRFFVLLIIPLYVIVRAFFRNLAFHEVFLPFPIDNRDAP